MKAIDLRELDVEGLRARALELEDEAVPDARPQVDGAAREAGQDPRRARATWPG